MTTKQLLSSNSYIQYPRFLGFYIGVNEAILLSALCDKDSLCEYSYDDYDGWFFYLKDEIEIDTGLSESQQRSALKSLMNLNIISTERHNCPSIVYYNIDITELENVLNAAYNEYKVHKSQWSQNMTTSDTKNMTTSSHKNCVSSINIKNKNIKINNKSTGTGALVKHPRNFSKQTLTDDLQSGKDIDEQKKEKKKTSEYDKCVEEINKRYENTSIHMLLAQHLDWSYHSKDPQRIRSLRTYKRRLDDLDKLNDLEGSIKQSIDKQWHCFYEVAEHNTRSRNTVDNSSITRQTLSAEEAEKTLAEYAERNGVV